MLRPPRLTADAYTGFRRCFLTMCTARRAEHFRDASIVALVLDQFFYTSRTEDVAIVAYCVMPDHVHLLVDGESESSDVARFAKLAKQRSGFRFRRAYRAALWQDGYNDRVLRDEERTEVVVAYIINNPVRKGLVENVMDYPFWGSGRYSRTELLDSIALRRV
jgi:putative transposase